MRKIAQIDDCAKFPQHFDKIADKYDEGKGTVLGSILGTWSGRLLLSATLLGGGAGAAMQYNQMRDADPFAKDGAAMTASPDDDDAFKDDLVRAAPLDDSESIEATHIEILGDNEIEKTGTPEDNSDEPIGDMSYELNILSRQVAGPLVDGVLITAPSQYLESKGAYRMTYAHRVADPRDQMYAVPWQRGFFSRKTVAGQLFRKFLPPNLRDRPANVTDQIYLHRSGAALRSAANGMMALPYAVRLGTNILALHEIGENGQNGLGEAERAVIFADTAMVTSHIADYSLFTIGLRKIAKGNGSGGARMLTYGHGVNVFSNSLSILAGALRFNAELERQEKTGESNPTSYFYSFMDMGYGMIGIAFSAYVLYYMRRMRRRKEESEGEELESYKANNILMGIFKLPLVVQDGMRAVSTLGASAALGINGTNLMNGLFNPTLADIATNDLLISSPLGLAGSAFALGAAYTLTPATYSISRALMAGGALFIAGQTIYDFWPLIAAFLSI